MHEQHLRTWIPFLGIGLIIGVIVVFGAWGMDWQGGSAKDTPISLLQSTKAPSAEAYQTQVHDMVGMLDLWSADEMYGIVLSMRVPGEYRTFHFALVQALEHLRAGRVDAGTTAITELKNNYPWLAEEIILPLNP